MLDFVSRLFNSIISKTLGSKSESKNHKEKGEMGNLTMTH